MTAGAVRRSIRLTFEMAKAVKAAKGKREYRPDGGPFVGDAAVELREEGVDIGAYADQLYCEGRIDEETHRRLNVMGEDIWAFSYTVPSQEIEAPHLSQEGLTSCGSL